MEGDLEGIARVPFVIADYAAIGKTLLMGRVYAL